LEIRSGITTDLDAIVRLDPIAHREQNRVAFIRPSLDSAYCLVATDDGKIFAYAVLDSFFYGRAYIPMLYVEPQLHRRGVASAPTRRMQTASHDEELFSSTNQSTQTAQALLAKMAYRRSSVIGNLDEADSELIYFKDSGERAG